MRNETSTPIKNNADLLQFIFKQMGSLERGAIDINEAKAQALLSKQANNILRTELDRAKLLINLHRWNQSNDEKIEIRELEK